MKKKYLLGFTLIELLVVMAVLALIGGVIMSIFFSVLRGTNKANKLIVVRQNGNYAISQITKILRESKSIINPDCSQSTGVTNPSITILGSDDMQTILELNGYSIASNSANPASLTDSNVVKVSNFSISCSQAADSNAVLIYITFDVSQLNDNEAVENKASETFSTSIAVRNYQ